VGVFIPMDCSIDIATPWWLLAAIAALALAGFALLVLVAVLWRRMGRAHAAWWEMLLPVLPLAWAGVCGLLTVDAWGYYRLVTAPLSCDPLRQPGCGLNGRCLGVAAVGGGAQLTLIIAVSMLILGWLALSQFPRRTQAAETPPLS
jgi:hypothetical protein